MDTPTIHIVGIRNRREQDFTQAVKSLLTKASVFSGGQRHRDIVRDMLPKEHSWIPIKGGMMALIEAYQTSRSDVVIFASGDPLFYGIGNTLMRLWPEVNLQTYPTFNSIQLLCHRTQTNYNALKTVSVHGRDWSALDAAIIEQQPLVGVLTDGLKTPQKIAQRLIRYGYDNYEIIVGENLDAPNEKVHRYDLEGCEAESFAPLNCVLLIRQGHSIRQSGIPNNAFEHLEGRPNMITKKAIRTNTIAALELFGKKVFWDIGSCTGSVAIEAKLAQPNLSVIAFEKRLECEAIIQKNAEKLGAPGIEIVMGDFFENSTDNLPQPDAVFIGGHGGKLKEMIEIMHRFSSEALIVTNAVQEKSVKVFHETAKALGLSLHQTKLTVDDHNPIALITARLFKGRVWR